MVGKTGVDGTITYGYNDEDRLIETAGPEGWAKFTYDASGNRIGRMTASGATAWLIDPNMPYAQVLEESAGGATKVYAYGLDLLNAQGSGGTSWFAYDGLGSIRGLTDTGGNLTDAYTYEGFGSIVNQTGTAGNEFLFTGEQWEPGLGMYYLRARYYGQEWGRFCSTDPFQGISMLPGTLHKYAYVRGDPANSIDPTGRHEYTLPALCTTLGLVTMLTISSVNSNLETYVTNFAFGFVVGYQLYLIYIAVITAITLHQLDRQTQTLTLDTNSYGFHKQIITSNQTIRIILAGDDAEVLDFASNVKPIYGYTDVVIHGSNDSFWAFRSDKWVPIDHRALATYIQKSGWSGGSIRLISCESGQLTNGVAQNLANKLGTTVIAPSDFVYIHRNGMLTIGSETINTGVWNVFIPTTPPGL